MSKLEDIVAFSDIQVTAYVQPQQGEAFELEITSISLRFEENQIPSAMLQIALGESPQQGGGTLVAKAHSRAQDLEQWDAVEVRIKLKGHQTPEKEWEKDGEFDIFRGYVRRPAYSMGTGTAGLMLELDHWLATLGATSKFSYMASVLSPAHFTKPVMVESFTGGQVCFDGDKVNYQSEAAQDVWGNTKKLFRYLAGKDRICAGELDVSGFSDITNAVALTALDQMDKGKVKVLKLAKDSPELAERVNGSIAYLATARETGNSYWETLLTMCNEYMFSVVPTVFTATCAPVLKTVKTPMLTISASEYDQISVNGLNSPVPIRAVGYYQLANTFTLDDSGRTQDDYLIDKNLVGFCDLADDVPNDDTSRRGQFLLLFTPSWMTNGSGCFEGYVPDNMPRRPVNCGANCRAGGEEPKDKSPNKKEKEVTEPNSPDRIGKALARTKLSDVVWGSRQGTVRGRLRFDIAPGSPIAVEIIGKNVPFYRSNGDNSKKLHAHVYRVEIDIDATQPSASTTLHLSHMRTEAENNRFGSIVRDQHPLYTDVWDGTSLLDGDA